jgi:hypothetical protein
MDPVQIRIEAEVKDALDKILRLRSDFIGFKDEYKKAITEMANVSNKFSGDQLTRTATQYMAVIQQFGGINKLTAAEQVKVNKVLVEAAEKYKLLGREVPAAMQKMIKATSQAAVQQKEDAKKILDAMKGKDMMEQAKLYVQAVTKIGGATKLTETEQAKLNKILTEVAAKYRALGKEVPESIQKIITETTKIKIAKDELEKLRNALSGTTIKQQAEGYIKTIKDVGGAAKLTADEQKKALDVLTKYEQKMVATGNTVPTAVRKMITELKGLKPATDELKKLEGALSGRDIIKSANGYIEVLRRIGGITKLTADEQKKVNGILQEAAAKYRALGQQVPADLQKILDATKANGNQVGGFFDQVWFQIAKGSTVGNLAANAISAAWRGIRDAVGAAVDMVIEFGKRGAEVERIASGFEKLVPTLRQEGPGGKPSNLRETPERIISSTRAALKGLATDMEIMTAANQAILFGIPITAEKFGVLAKSAVTLGRAMGLDAGKALNDLIVALGRTSPRILDNLGIIVKVTEANNKYAASIGKNRLELSAEERTIAFTNEALRKMGERVEDIGDLNLNFGDKLKVVQVGLANIRDEIGKQIAVNPVLNKLIEDSGRILLNTFGSNTQAQVKTLSLIITELGIITSKVISGVIMPAMTSMTLALGTVIRQTMDLMAQTVAQATAVMNIFEKVGAIGGKIPGQFGDMFDQMRLLSLAGKSTIKEFFPDPVKLRKDGAAVEDAAKSVAKGMAVATAQFEILSKDLEKLRNKPPVSAANMLPKITNNDLENTIADPELPKKLSKADAAWIDTFEKSKQKYVQEAVEFQAWFETWTLQQQAKQNKYNQVILDRLSAQNKNFVMLGAEATRQLQEEIDQMNLRKSTTLVDVQKAMGQFTTKIIDPPKIKGQFNKAIADMAKDLPQVIARAIQGGGDIGKAIATTIGGSIGSSLFGPEGSLGKMVGKWANKLGPDIGAAIGQAIPFVGEMLGQLAGMGINKLVEVFRKPAYKDIMRTVGREWGTEISEELAKAIEKTSKTKFGGDRRAAELSHFKDILDAAKGLNAANFDQFTKKMRDVFVMLDTGKFTLQQTTDILNENFGAFADYVLKSGKLASDGFLELLRLNKQFGTESAAVKQFITDQAGQLGDAFTKLTAVGAAKYKELGDKLKAAREALDKANKDVTDAGPDRAGADMLEAQRRAAEEYNAILGEQGKSAADAQKEFDRLGRLALVSFNALEKQGLTTSQILDKLGPSFNNLIELQKSLGLASSNAAVQELLNLQAKREANMELFNSADAINQTAVALYNLNGIDQETFNDLAAQAEATRAAFVNVGLTEKQALAEIAPFLRTAIELHAKKGIAIDEATQALIDQARAEGVLGESTMTTAEIMKSGFEGVKDGLAALIETLGGKVPDSLRKMADVAIAEGGRAKTGMDKMKDGALLVGGAVDGISRKIGGIRDHLLSVDFEGWAANAADALGGVQDEVDAVSLGRSPGGLKEIPIKAQEAVNAFRAMMAQSRPELEELYRLVNGVNPAIDAAVATPKISMMTEADPALLGLIAELRDITANRPYWVTVSLNGTVIADGDLENITHTKIAGMTLDAVAAGGNLGARFDRLVGK